MKQMSKTMGHVAVLSYLLALVVLWDSSIRMAHADQSVRACERDQDCKNGGTCEMAVENGSEVDFCLCPERYSGPNCENFCSLECLNGGFCEFRVDTIDIDVIFRDENKSDSSIFCICEGKFEGKHCESPYVVCPDLSKCLNGGECSEVTTEAGTWSYTCECPQGYSGEFCDIPPDEGSIFVDLKDSAGTHTFVVITSIIALIGCLATAVVWYRIKRKERSQMIHEAVKNSTSAFEDKPWTNVQSSNAGGTVWYDVEPEERPAMPSRAKAVEASLL